MRHLELGRRGFLTSGVVVAGASLLDGPFPQKSVALAADRDHVGPFEIPPGSVATPGIRLDTSGKKPVFLPGKVAFGSRRLDDGLDFSLTNPGNGAPHLVGRARKS